MSRQIASHAALPSLAWMPRSAIISTSWSASSRYISTPLLCSVSHTRNCENTSTPRSAALCLRRKAGKSSAASTAKRICPPCLDSLSRIACSMAFIERAGNAALTAILPVIRCFKKRCIFITIAPKRRRRRIRHHRHRNPRCHQSHRRRTHRHQSPRHCVFRRPSGHGFHPAK